MRESHADSNADGYAYTDSYAHRDTLSDANVHSRGYAWSVDTGSAGGDRSLRGLHGQRWDLCV
jgi:hypothetical protein